MAFGPGKYDDLATSARADAKAEGVLLIVVNGRHGSGFSAQLTPEHFSTVPDLLRTLAAQLERDRSTLTPHDGLTHFTGDQIPICPLCRAHLDGARTSDGSNIPPIPGDINLCAYCLNWLTFEKDMTLRVLSNAEFLALPRARRVEMEALRTNIKKAWETPRP